MYFHIGRNLMKWPTIYISIRYQAEVNNITVAKYLAFQTPLGQDNTHTALTQARMLQEVAEVSRSKFSVFQCPHQHTIYIEVIGHAC